MDLIAGVNTYATLDAANSYFEFRLDAAMWFNAPGGDESRKASLLMATDKIDRLRFKGKKYDSKQQLQFPRYPEKTIPQIVIKACCEEAFALLQGIPERIRLQQQGVTSFTIGDLSESYSSHVTHNLISPEAKLFLKPYMMGAVRIT